MRQMKVAVEMLEQPDAGERKGLIDLARDGVHVRAQSDQFARGMVGQRFGGGVLEGAGIGGNRGKKTIGNGRRDWPLSGLEKTKNQFAGRSLAGGNPIQIAVARVAQVMVDVDEAFAPGNGRPGDTQALEGGAIGGDNQIKLVAVGGLLEDVMRIQKRVFLRHHIFVPTNHVLSLLAQRQREADLGADAIAVGPDMAGDTNRLAGGYRLEDAIDDLGSGFHEEDEGFSNSSRSWRTRLPRSIDSSRIKRRCGVYLRTTALPKSP